MNIFFDSTASEMHSHVLTEVLKKADGIMTSSFTSKRLLMTVLKQWQSPF